jgi:hypothetical protein
VYPEQENKTILPLLPLEILAPCKVRWVWAGAVIFASATCPLQFTEAIGIIRGLGCSIIEDFFRSFFTSVFVETLRGREALAAILPEEHE